MGLADTAELVVKLTMAGNFAGQMAATRRGLRGFAADLASTESRAYRAGQQIGTGIRNVGRLAVVGVGLLTSQLAFGLDKLVQLEELTGQTGAAIKSTGGVAGITATQVRTLAEEYENLNATIDDKVIQSAENLLLTFTNVRGKAFEPALEAILDMNTALGRGEGGLEGTVLQVGKALNDPIRGITALRRAGVNFTADQEKLIKTLVEEGRLLEAQQVILDELGTEFGGRFKAQGESARGTIAGIGDAVEDLQTALATALFPTIQKVLPRVRDFLASPELQRNVEDLGKSIAGLFSEENIRAGTDILKSVMQAAREAAPIVADAAKVMAGIVSTAVSVFRSLPPEIQQLAIGAFAINKLTGGLVTNVAGAAAGGIAEFLSKRFAGVMTVTAGTVVVSGAVGGGKPGGIPGGAALGGLGAVAGGTALTGVVIMGVTQAAASSLTGAIVTGVSGSAKKGQIAADVQTFAGGGILPIIGPLNRLIDALNGDLRSPDQQAATEKLRGEFAGIKTAQSLQASRQLIANERLEAIRGYTAGQSAAASTLLRSNERQESIAIQNAAKVTAQLAAGDTRTELAIGRAAAIQAGATRQGAADTRSEMAAVRQAVNAKDLSVAVTVPVNVDTRVSVQNVTKVTNTYKSVYNVAS